MVNGVDLNAVAVVVRIVETGVDYRIGLNHFFTHH